MRLLKILIWCLDLIYRPFRHLRQKRRITMISRQSDSCSTDFEMLKDEIEDKHKDIDVVILCRKLEKGIIKKIRYIFHMFKQMYYIATSEVVVLDTYCIAASVLTHRKGTKIVQIWHSSIAVKKFGYQTLDRQDGSSSRIAGIMNMHGNYDHVTAPGKRTAELFAEGFNVSISQMKTAGLPRLDLILRGGNVKAEEIIRRYPQTALKENILYAPTFRKNRETDVKGVISAIDLDRYNLIVKQHPLDHMNIDISGYEGVIKDDEFETLEWFKMCRKVITDYSAVGIEAAVADREVYYYIYDADEYAERTGLNIDLEKEPVADYTARDPGELRKVIEMPYDHKKTQMFRDRYIETADGRCTEKLASFIVSLMRKKEEDSIISAEALFPVYRNRKDSIEIRFRLKLTSNGRPQTSAFGFCTGEYELDSLFSKIETREKNGVFHTSCRCRIRIDRSLIKDLHTKNPIILTALIEGSRYTSGLTSRWYCGKYAGVLTDKVFILEEEKLSCYFLITKNNLVMTVRDINVTDRMPEKIKLAAAYLISRLMFTFRPVVLYEKNASRYEESGAAVYEALKDRGCGNAYFILDPGCRYKDEISPAYRKNIIDRYSFRHYLYFFSASTFIGSEMPAHALELRTVSKFVRLHLSRGSYGFVFLQHGVMYMVSLDSGSRSFFRSTAKKRGIRRIVTSSELENRHFIEQGGYKREELYMTGLPKFDRNILHEDCDRIAVMLTWRPWEEKECRRDVRSTTYYKAVKSIIEAVPEDLRGRIWVMPHPLVQEEIRRQDTEIAAYMAPDEKYDVLLRSVKILITDYSSIAYDAFYRGSSVIFYWKEKDGCIARYGEDAKLMLTQELAFGDVCFSSSEIAGAVRKRIDTGQEKRFKDNYSKIVSFHDGHNTDRLIEMLEKENLI